jgi:hypothetical protein
MKVQCPLVHLNGTAKVDLVEQVRNACHKARGFKEALSEMYPNARDYYPLGEQAYINVKSQMLDRMCALNGIISQLEAIYEGIEEGVTEVEIED